VSAACVRECENEPNLFNGCRRRCPRRQSKTPQDLFDDIGLFNRGDDFHAAATTITEKNIYREDAPHQLRPGIVAFAHALRGFSIDSRHLARFGTATCSGK
jgi:hypothetical protein